MYYAHDLPSMRYFGLWYPREGGMEVRRFADIDEFLGVAGGFLGEREAEHNLIFGICSNLRTNPGMFGGPPYLAAITDRSRVVAVALRTPPHRLILSEIDDPAAIRLLVEDARSPGLSGVLGPKEHVRAFVEAWTAGGEPPARLAISERIYRLTAVSPPRPVPGAVRVATHADRDLVVAWTEGFMRDAFGDADPAEVVSTADRWLSGSERTLYLWVDGEPTSLAGVGGPTPNGIRIGPVYTPPAARRRGYASALVAAVSQAELDAGRRFCFLFTDLANPTSNHVYQDIGYEPVRDVDAYTFEAP
jgi:predicted GNAT family acetyltransferase